MYLFKFSCTSLDDGGWTAALGGTQRDPVPAWHSLAHVGSCMAPHGTTHGHSCGAHVPLGHRGSPQCVPAHGAEGRGFSLHPHVCMLCLPCALLFLQYNCLPVTDVSRTTQAVLTLIFLFILSTCSFFKFLVNNNKNVTYIRA